MTREMKPFILLGHGETNDEQVKEFGPAGSLEKLEGADARAKVAEGDPKDVEPVELKIPPKTARTVDGSDLSQTAGG